MIALTAGPELYSSEVDGISATVSQPEQLVAVSRAVENSQKAIRSAVNVQTARAARRRRAKAEFIVSLDTMDEYTTAECSHSICPSLKRLLRRKMALRNKERAQRCVTVFESHAPKRAALLSASGLQANRIGLVKNCWRSLPCAYAALSSLLLCWRAFSLRQSMLRASSDKCRGPG